MKVGARVLEIASPSWQRGSKVQWMMAFFNKERVERSTARGREHSSGTTCRGNTLLGKGGTQCNGTMPLVWALSLLVQAKNQHVVYHRTNLLGYDHCFLEKTCGGMDPYLTNIEGPWRHSDAYRTRATTGGRLVPFYENALS